MSGVQVRQNSQAEHIPLLSYATVAGVTLCQGLQESPVSSVQSQVRQEVTLSMGHQKKFIPRVTHRPHIGDFGETAIVVNSQAEYLPMSSRITGENVTLSKVLQDSPVSTLSMYPASHKKERSLSICGQIWSVNKLTIAQSGGPLRGHGNGW